MPTCNVSEEKEIMNFSDYSDYDHYRDPLFPRNLFTHEQVVFSQLDFDLITGF